MEIQQYKVATVGSKSVITANAAGTANITATTEWKNSNLQRNCQECNVHQQNSCHSLCWRNTASYTLKATSAIGGSKICNKQQERCNCKLQRCCNSKEQQVQQLITATAERKAQLTYKVTVKNPSIAAKAAKTTIYTKGQTSTTDYSNQDTVFPELRNSQAATRTLQP